MRHLQPAKTGLAVGMFYALWHFTWVVMVAAGVAKPFLDWVLSLHFLSFVYSVKPFAIGPAVFLVVFTFVVGYGMGWIFASLWNRFQS